MILYQGEGARFAVRARRSCPGQVVGLFFGRDYDHGAWRVYDSSEEITVEEEMVKRIQQRRGRAAVW